MATDKLTPTPTHPRRLGLRRPLAANLPAIHRSITADGTIENNLETGETYLGQAVVYPDFLATGAFPLNTPVLVSELNTVWVPGGVHVRPNRDDATVTNPLALPAGAWGVS